MFGSYSRCYNGSEKGWGTPVIATVTPVGRSGSVFSLLLACLAAGLLIRPARLGSSELLEALLQQATERWQGDAGRLMSELQRPDDSQGAAVPWLRDRGVVIGESIPCHRLRKRSGTGLELLPGRSGGSSSAVTTPLGFCPDPALCLAVLSRCESGLLIAARTPDLEWGHLFGHLFYTDAHDLSFPVATEAPWAALRLTVKGR